MVSGVRAWSRGRILASGGVAASAVAITIAAVLGGGGPPSDGLANLWVDTNGGTCTRQASAAAYDDASACGSIDAAWDAATSGDTIRMRTGSYGAQTITGNKTQATTVIGGDGGTTTIGTLDTQGDWLELQNVTGSTWDTGTSNTTATIGDNVTLRNVKLGRVWLDSGNNQRMIGGEVGPSCSSSTEPIWLNGQSFDLTNTVFDGVNVHDNTSCNAGWHLEMFRIDGGINGVTLKNSTFTGNQSNTSTVFITNQLTGLGRPNPTNITIEGNVFGPDGNATIHTQDPTISTCGTYRFAYNTFRNAPLTMACTGGAVTVIGNVGWKDWGGCTGTYQHNVWQNSSNNTCGTDTWVSGPGSSVSNLGLGGADGFHLTAASPARGVGEPTDCPAVDHDGETRPQPAATTCDAGADEVG